MIFSLVSSAQEWLNVQWDNFKKEEENRILEKQKELEEAERVSVTKKNSLILEIFKKSCKFQNDEQNILKTYNFQKRFEGTRVTVETFLNWRNEFERDIGLTDKREKQSKIGKLTGRELFMQDKTLNESDLKFLEAAGDSVENVKIDESLFQNLDDLEFGSDEDDDDYVPGADDSD